MAKRRTGMMHNISSLNHKKLIVAILTIASLLPAGLMAASNNPKTDWFSNAQYGVFMHFLPGDAQGLARVNDFDVEALAVHYHARPRGLTQAAIPLCWSDG